MIRQCRKAKSKGSSFFSEKSTLNIGLGWVSVILPPHCVRSLGSVYHSHWRSIRFADAVFGQADTAQLLYLFFLASTPARLSEKRILTSRTLRFVIFPRYSSLGDFLLVSLHRSHSVLRQSAPLTLFGDRKTAIAGLLAARPGAPFAGIHPRLPGHAYRPLLRTTFLESSKLFCFLADFSGCLLRHSARASFNCSIKSGNGGFPMFALGETMYRAALRILAVHRRTFF